MYSNRLQPALQNLLQCVRFFHPRSSCKMQLSMDIFHGRKSLVKPVTWQKTCNYIELFGSSTEIVLHDDTYIGRRSDNNVNAACMMISGGRTKQLYIFCRITGFMSDFLSFIVVETIRFFNGALQLSYLPVHCVCDIKPLCWCRCQNTVLGL